jgi:hypothetical protein
MSMVYQESEQFLEIYRDTQYELVVNGISSVVYGSLAKLLPVGPGHTIL